MTLQDCEKSKNNLAVKMDKLAKEHSQTMKELQWEMDEIQRQKQLLLNDCDLSKVMLAEHVLYIEKTESLQGDDVSSIEGVIRELAENKGEKLYSEYMATKNYDRWSHQGIGWTTYGFGPKHGSTVFCVGMRRPLREEKRPLTADEIEASIYMLEKLKAGKYEPAKK